MIKRLLIVSFLALCTNYVHSSILPQDAKSFSITTFEKGLNTKDISYKLEDGFSPNLLNVEIDDEDGRLTKVHGFEVLGATSSLTKITFFRKFVKTDGTSEYLVSDGASVLMTKDFLTYSSIKSGLNNNYNLDGTQIRDKYWFTNGFNSVFTYNGSTVVNLDGGSYGAGVTVANAPKGKYIEFYQERVWLYNINTDNSAVRWTDLVSTSSLQIAPDSELAFPSLNQLDIGQGDGTVGTAMFIYRNKLYLAKDNAIYTINGDNSYNYFANKTDSSVGISNDEALTSMDNYVYFKSKNEGIYAFDGNNSQRISDVYDSEINKFATDSLSASNVAWDDYSDFSGGEFKNSTPTATGSVDIITRIPQTIRTFPDSIDGAGAGCGSVSPFSTLTVLNQIYPNGYWYIYQSTFVSSLAVGESDSDFFSIKNINTLETMTSNAGTLWTFVANKADLCGEGVYSVYLTIINPSDFPTKTTFTSDEINNVSLTSIAVSQINNNGSTVWYRPGTTGNYGMSMIANYSTYSYVSTVKNKSSGYDWGIFTADADEGDGNIKYFYKTATSAVNITTYPWIPILNNGIISSSGTDNYIQFASSFSGNSIENCPILDKVSISYFLPNSAGGKNPILANYKNQLWIIGSTDTTSNNNVIYKKNKITSKYPNGVTKITGINIRSILRSGTYFYAGSSTSGVILNLEAGTNFSGSTISAYYETPDLDFGNTFFKKELLRIYIDAEKETGGTITLGISIDGGAYTYYDISVDGSGRYLKELNGITSKNGKYFRFRFINNQINKNLKINNFMVIYKETQRD